MGEWDIDAGGGAGAGVSSFNSRSGAVTLAASDVEALFTLKGQVFVGSGSGSGLLLPIGTTGQVLTVSGGTAAWEDSAGGFTAGGDLSGTSSSQTVVGIDGKPVSAASPSANQGLIWNGSDWVAAAIANSYNGRTGAVTPQASDVEGLFSAAGQLFAGTGSATGELLAAGSSGQVLTVGGADPSGLEWATPAAGASSGVISVVGTMATTSDENAFSLRTLAFTAVNVGDLLVTCVQCNNTGTTLLSGVATSGTMTTDAWKKAIQYDGTGQASDYEIWYTIVRGVGAGTITYTWAVNPTSSLEYTCLEFHVTGGASWVLDSATSHETASGTPVNFPSITPAGAGELYVGFAGINSFPINGFTSGYSYPGTSNSNLVTFNPACSSSAQAPTASQTTAHAASAIGAMFRAVPVISAVGTPMNATAPTGLTTLAVTGLNVGDLLVVWADLSSPLTDTLASIATSGTLTTTAWQKAVQFTGTVHLTDMEIWYAKITGTGAGTLTFTWNTSIAALQADYSCVEFHMTGGTNTWTVDTTAHLDTTSASNTLTFPSLTPAGAGELYVGASDFNNTAITGSTAGYNWLISANAALIAYNVECTSAAQQPTGTVSGGQTSAAVAVAALIKAS